MKKLKNNLVQGYVIDFKPDLLIIGGISNNGNVDAIRNVILQVRQKINPEIIFMNEIFGKMGKKGNEFLYNKTYTNNLQQLAQQTRIEFFDIGSHWRKYLISANKPYQ